MITVKKYQTGKEAGSGAVQNLFTILAENEMIPILLLFSGGSWLSLTIQNMAFFIHKNLSLSLLDERYSPLEKERNYYQLINSPLFLQIQQFSPLNLFPYSQNMDDTKEDIAEHVEKTFRNWKAQNPHGKIIICQGIGSDCHTAGIMPFPKDNTNFNTLFESKNWVCSYDAAGKSVYPLRITVTNTFLRIVDTSIVYLTGDDKKNAFYSLHLASKKLNLFPGQIIQEMKDVIIHSNL